MSKLILRDDGIGIARKSYDDQDGCKWIETDTRGYLDENECTECGQDTGWTLMCLDGGDAYCEKCLSKLFDIEYV